MEPMMEYHSVTAKMSGWELAMLSDAIDSYAMENGENIDCSALIIFADTIDEKIGIKNFKE